MVSCAFTRFGSAKIVNGGRKAKQKIIIFLSDLATFMHRVEAEHIHQDKFRGACDMPPGMLCQVSRETIAVII